MITWKRDAKWLSYRTGVLIMLAGFAVIIAGIPIAASGHPGLGFLCLLVGFSLWFNAMLYTDPGAKSRQSRGHVATVATYRPPRRAADHTHAISMSREEP